jgi:prevent-host-death family protein
MILGRPAGVRLSASGSPVSALTSCLDNCIASIYLKRTPKGEIEKMAKIISISTLRQGVTQVVKELREHRQPWTLIQRSRPVAVLLDYETFEAMQSRLRELEEEHLLRVVAEGRDEHRRGKTRKINSLADLR